ncbi:MAG TPA: YdcF family protein [Candidatus Acidoferrales bacterium]|nr:YdcF family protein [Candidatus Acidoferrales bacterium]
MNLSPPPHRVRTISLALALLALVTAGILAFRATGRWLVRPDPLAPGGAIAILSGSMPARAEEAARIFRMGYSRQVWITRPVSPAGELARMGISYAGEDDYSRQVLIHEGVPAQAIRILPAPVVDTQQEVQEISREARAEGDRSLIIVTSPEHTRRVKALWRKLVGHSPSVIVRGAPQDDFDADHWWRNTHDALAVVREIMGLLNVWMGLPVRPNSG